MSNGSLMRLTPLCIWSHRLSEADMFKAMRQESLLTHPNETIAYCNTAYGLAIQYLLGHPGDNEGAYKRVLEYVKGCENEELKSWIALVEKEELPKVNYNKGFV